METGNYFMEIFTKDCNDIICREAAFLNRVTEGLSPSPEVSGR